MKNEHDDTPHSVLATLDFESNTPGAVLIDGKPILAQALTIRAGYNGYSNAIIELDVNGLIDITAAIQVKLNTEPEKYVRCVKAALEKSELEFSGPVGDEQYAEFGMRVMENLINIKGQTE